MQLKSNRFSFFVKVVNIKELQYNRIDHLCYITTYSQTVYKGHSKEPENVAFMSSCPLKLYALFNNGKNETALYRQ
jgi:hypothetical protein